MGPTSASRQLNVEEFVKFWTDRSVGAERADAQTFLNQLCELIGVDGPHQAQAKGIAADDYCFERLVHFRHDDGSTSPGRIDLYKKGSFVLEAKQSKNAQKAVRFTSSWLLHSARKVLAAPLSSIAHASNRKNRMHAR